MSWIERISNTINNAFSKVRPPAKSIPPMLLLPETKKRPGLSSIALTNAIISRLSEAGIETGVNADGSPNKINQFVRILSEEIIKEIKDNAKVTCSIDSGSIISQGTGSSAAGPVTVITHNTMISGTEGIIQ